MTNKQEDKLGMYFAIQKIVNENNATWNSLVAYGNAFAEFEQLIQNIQNRRVVQEQDIRGVTVNKHEAENLLIEKALEVARAAHAYATDIGDSILLEKVNYSESDLRTSRDTILIDQCQVIHDETNGVVGNMGDYGTDASDITELKSRIDAYEAVVASPRIAITERANATANIEALFASGDSILANRMDKLMSQFKSSAPEFFSKYFTARAVVETGGRSTVLTGVVTDGDSNDPIEDALVEIVRDNNGNGNGIVDGSVNGNGTGKAKANGSVPDVTVTTGDGKFILEHVRNGKVLLRITKDGYLVKELPDFVIKRGKVNEVDVALDAEVDPVVTG